MSLDILFVLLLGAPLVGFLINGFNFRSSNAKLAGTIATAAAFVAFLAAVVLTLQLTKGQDRRLSIHLAEWFLTQEFSVRWGFVIDPLSSVMILIITGVGTLIHLFSVGYMSHDERPAKYFAYLNLFLFNMLILVTGDSLLTMFVGWEGVGLCSYLLIGFWFKDDAKAAAGMKAFIVNRIGDAGFLLGMFVLYANFKTLEFATLNATLSSVPEMGWSGPITLACLFLFIGATGKSAQIPLYVWLPDAMAGPTPVSALIHAATMVTAGVYMIVRLSPVFLMAPNAMMVIATVGAVTALLGALIGLVQWDIKKVLAYSTVSQLGYMFLAVGVGAFTPALFHLMTHAFFKALMFLGSGSVIHAMHEEQDIRKMGGLSKYMPITYWTFFVGWLAIIGVPPLSGFFSKDEILWSAFASPYGNKAIWFIAVVTAGLTAFYMTRMMCLVFWGSARFDAKHAHESPLSMTLPLMVLAVPAAFAGLLGIPHAISAILPGHPPHLLEGWLGAIVAKTEMHGSLATEWVLIFLSVGIAVFSAGMAYHFYIRQPSLPGRVVAASGPFYNIVAAKFFVDEFYFGRIVWPLVSAAKSLWLYVDVSFIDKATYVISDWVRSLSSASRDFQNGNLQRYAFYISMGMAGVLIFLLMR